MALIVPAPAFDVGHQELGDVLGSAVGRVLLERVERQAVVVLHLGGEAVTDRVTVRAECAPDRLGVAPLHVAASDSVGLLAHDLHDVGESSG